MSTRRLLVLEPSKVGTQHITLIAQYLESALNAEDREVEFWCAPSTWASVPYGLKPRLRHRAIPVIDPSSRRFLLKIPLEVVVTLTAILRKRRDDVLLVTCLFSPALYFVAQACRLLRPRFVFIALHSEVEALVDASLSPWITGYGYWIRRFWKRCLDADAPGLLVLNRFIRERLLDLSEGRLRPERIGVLTMPIQAIEQVAGEREEQKPGTKPKVCFVGYRTRLKGFDTFASMAAARDDFTWLAVGGGVIENVVTGEVTSLDRPEDFAHAVAACDVALFPYEGGYDVSMSAAVLDAIAAGVYVIATRRGCFIALSEVLGEDVVQCAEGIEEMNRALSAWCARPERLDRSTIARRIAASPFSAERLDMEMRALMTSGSTLPAKAEALS